MEYSKSRNVSAVAGYFYASWLGAGHGEGVGCEGKSFR